MPQTGHILVILGGDIAREAVVRAHAAHATRIVCADSGAEHARNLGLDVYAIVGDLDSITPETLAYYQTRGAEIASRPDQNFDDFQKTLDFVAATHTGPVSVLGLTGLRTDHLLANLSVMLLMTDRFEQLVAFDDHASYRFLTGSRKFISFECPVGTLVSLMPFGEASGVTTTNLLYPLVSDDLSLARRTGLSNRAIGSPVEIKISGGTLLVSVGQ